jgi:hypothetical protein
MSTQLKVNASVWNKLSPEHKTQIENIIVSAGMLPGMTITPDAATPEFHWPNPKKALCEAACGAAEAVADAACNGISDGTAFAVCLAVAHAAGDACRSHC